MNRRTHATCPIVYSLDIWGDRWSLVILRDVLIGNKKYYREFLASPEGIATNILSSRLKSLAEAGLLTKTKGQTNRAQTTYQPTQKALNLVPAILAIMQWGIQYNPNVDMDIPVMQEVMRDKSGMEQHILQQFANTAR